LWDDVALKLITTLFNKLLGRYIIYPVFICLLSYSLSACQPSEAVQLPDYWQCAGKTTQRVIAATGTLQEYLGADPVLLEVFGGQVTQYISKPFTGVFTQCRNDAAVLAFQLGNCAAADTAQLLKQSQGQLDKQSGVLTLNEQKIGVNHTSQTMQTVQTQGRYTCRYLGHRYPHTIFYSHESE
jgi:hypothetical protein